MLTDSSLHPLFYSVLFFRLANRTFHSFELFQYFLFKNGIFQNVCWTELAKRASVRYRSNRPVSNACVIRATTDLVANRTTRASCRLARTALRVVIIQTARSIACALKATTVGIVPSQSVRLVSTKNLVSTTAPVPRMSYDLLFYYYFYLFLLRKGNKVKRTNK